jgi:hypothetical protein
MKNVRLGDKFLLELLTLDINDSVEGFTVDPFEGFLELKAS